MLFIVLFSVVNMFSNFPAILLLISPEVFGIHTPNFTTKVRKIWLNIWYQNQSDFEKKKKWGGMMLWIMSGTFNWLKVLLVTLSASDHNIIVADDDRSYLLKDLRTTILRVINLFCDVKVSSCIIILFTIMYEPFPL